MVHTLIMARFKTKGQGQLRIKSGGLSLPTYIKKIKEQDLKALLTMVA
jgi:hypothetical protein